MVWEYQSGSRLCGSVWWMYWRYSGEWGRGFFFLLFCQCGIQTLAHWHDEIIQGKESNLSVGWSVAES